MTAHAPDLAITASKPGASRSIVQTVAARLFDEPAEPPPPQIGRFERPTMISYGGMGVVHRALDPMLGRPVAIKLCRPDRPHRERDYQRLLVEARALAGLDHPNVVAVHEAGRLPDGQLYIALEYVEGEDLARWLATPRPWPDVVAAFAAAARGLEAVHRRGLVHRDIKPANILRRPDGLIKLIDFGLVKETPGDDPPDATDPLDTPHTETGRILGTRGYLAPELFLGAAPGVPSDIFSLCVGLYVGLYARRPFAATPRAHTSRAPTRPRPEPSERPVLGDILGPWTEPHRGERGVPRHIVAALRRGLAADPRARFQNVGELIAALTPRRIPRTTWLAGAAITACLTGAAWAHATTPAPCSTVADELADAWTSDRRDKVRAAFERTAITHAPDTFTAIDHQLTAYIAAWTAVRGDNCRARIDRRDPEATLDARTACLARAAQQLRAAVVHLESADAATVLHAPEQLAALPSPHACTDPQTSAQACHATPDDPALRTLVDDVDAAISESRAAAISGDFKNSITAAERAATLADTSALRGLQARARFALGEALRLAGHSRRATTEFLTARDAAQEVLCIDVLADTLGRLNKIAALSGGTPVAVADERITMQHTLAVALGPTHARLADAEHERGLVALHLHRDFTTAASAFTAAITIRRDLPHQDAHQKLALSDSHLGLASALARQGLHADADIAMHHAISERTAAVGPDHPSMYMPLLNQGNRLRERGDLDAAEALYKKALACASGYGETSRERTHVLTALTALAMRRGDLDAALTHARAATRTLDPTSTNIDWDALENLAQVLTDIGDPASAIPIIKRSLADRDHAADGVPRGYTRTRLADALLVADRPAEALEQAGLALTELRDAVDPRDEHLALAHLARGEALVALADTATGLHMSALDAADAAAALTGAIHIWTLRADNPARLALARHALARVRCEAQRSRDDARALAHAAREHLPDDLRPALDEWLRATCP